MREIGVRELKVGLSNVLRQVDEGEQMLVADGKVTPASRPRPNRSPRPLTTSHSASDIVLAERDDER